MILRSGGSISFTSFLALSAFSGAWGSWGERCFGGLAFTAKILMKKGLMKNGLGRRRAEVVGWGAWTSWPKRTGRQIWVWAGSQDETAAVHACIYFKIHRIAQHLDRSGGLGAVIWMMGYRSSLCVCEYGLQKRQTYHGIPRKQPFAL